jgi:hypothetical protein
MPSHVIATLTVWFVVHTLLWFCTGAGSWFWLGRGFHIFHWVEMFTWRSIGNWGEAHGADRFRETAKEMVKDGK